MSPAQQMFAFRFACCIGFVVGLTIGAEGNLSGAAVVVIALVPIVVCTVMGLRDLMREERARQRQR